MACKGGSKGGGSKSKGGKRAVAKASNFAKAGE